MKSNMTHKEALAISIGQRERVQPWGVNAKRSNFFLLVIGTTTHGMERHRMLKAIRNSSDIGRTRRQLLGQCQKGLNLCFIPIPNLWNQNDDSAMFGENEEEVGALLVLPTTQIHNASLKCETQKLKKKKLFLLFNLCFTLPAAALSCSPT
ncbi:hypothetical protein RIF29_23803 [Crotalaria pallida]|uniref:Uncharacterized protein n=1 Tax=Crotalaria pallida TaxID=3830 RepID=A0AAN9F6I0_CROPI